MSWLQRQIRLPQFPRGFQLITDRVNKTRSELIGGVRALADVDSAPRDATDLIGGFQAWLTLTAGDLR